jgi:hypothetical protein
MIIEIWPSKTRGCMALAGRGDEEVGKKAERERNLAKRRKE